MSKIAIGDRVAYSKAFLQSTGQLTGSIPHARGVVTAIKDYGGMVLATVDWKNEDIPSKVITSNLSTIKQVQMGE